MFITKNGVSMDDSGSVAFLHVPLIEENGMLTPAQEAGFTFTDRTEEMGGGLIRLHRKIINVSGSKRVFKLVTQVETAFQPADYLMPCIMYNGNQWGDGNSPKGLMKDGQPWIFAYDRMGIPSCTLTENAEVGFALFASDIDRDSLRTSASLVKQKDGTFMHRIYYPVTEAPVTYWAKNRMTDRYDEYITLNNGEVFSVQCYLYACTPRWEHYSCANLLDRMQEIFPFSREPIFTPEHAWELGIAYLKRLIHDYNGKTLIIAGIDTKISHRQATGRMSSITPEEMIEWMKIPEKNTFGFNREIYEIGWAGQGFLTCRLFMKEALRTGDQALLETCIGIQENWVEKQLENGMILGHFERYADYEAALAAGTIDNAQLCQGYTPETCNLGWGASEMAKIYALLKENGIDRPDFLRFSTRICDFFVENFSEKFGFGKSWSFDGHAVDTTGSVGGFILNGLLDTWKVTHDDRYLATAIKGFAFYYERDLKNFVCTAGAIDCVAVDKETSFPFVVSGLDLYEITGDNKYLEWAIQAAYYFFSWTFQYDALYPDTSDFAKYDYYTQGGTAISAEHHAIDPWGSLLTCEFVRIWKHTGDDKWLLRARMMWIQSLLGITREEGQIVCGKPRPLGSQNEGFFQARWTKYRPNCEERGHFNDWLVSWVSAYRLTALDRLTTVCGENDWHLFA